MIFFTSPAVPVIEQIPLIHTINEDDLILPNSPGGEWFRMLNSFPWQDYRELAAHYYDALYDFNRSESGDPDRTDDPGESEFFKVFVGNFPVSEISGSAGSGMKNYDHFFISPHLFASLCVGSRTSYPGTRQ